MSPEQAGGAAEIDGRSDIYSLGCVLYEMLGGEPPFTGPTPQSVMAKQVVAPLPSLRSQRPEVPEPVERVLAKALEKEPADRFATAAEFTAALEGAGTAPADRGGGRGRSRAAVLVGAGAIAATALLFAVGLGEREEKPPETPRIAVLPFQNLGSSDDDYFSDGITEEITSRLAMIPRLGVISRTSAEQYRETGKSIKEIGRELGVDYILEGSVRWEKSGGSSRVRVTPQLIRVSDDRHMWAGRYDETIAEVFQVQSRIAEQVASALDLALQRPQHEALAAKPTDDLRAYDFYLRGNEYLDRPGDPDALRGAEEMYGRATALDPTFALAFARLARTHIWQFHFCRADGGEARQGAVGRRFRAPAPAGSPGGPSGAGPDPLLGRARLRAGAPGIPHRARGRPGEQRHRLGSRTRRAAPGPVGRGAHRPAASGRPGSPVGVKILDLFEVHLRRRDYDAAERYLTRALELEPDSPAYIYRALLILARDGDLRAASAAIEEGIPRAGAEDMAFWALQFDFGSALWRVAGQLGAGGGRAALHASPSAPTRPRITCRRPGSGGPRADTQLGPGLLRLRGEDPRVGRPGPPGGPVATRRARHRVRGPGPSRGRHPRRPAAVALRPPSKDTWLGVDMVRNLAVVYATLGQADSAVAQLRFLLTVPSWISPPALKADPTWDPIRRNPGFRKLVGGGG